MRYRPSHYVLKSQSAFLVHPDGAISSELVTYCPDPAFSGPPFLLLARYVPNV